MSDNLPSEPSSVVDQIFEVFFENLETDSGIDKDSIAKLRKLVNSRTIDYPSIAKVIEESKDV